MRRQAQQSRIGAAAAVDLAWQQQMKKGTRIWHSRSRKRKRGEYIEEDEEIERTAAEKESQQKRKCGRMTAGEDGHEPCADKSSRLTYQTSPMQKSRGLSCVQINTINVSALKFKEPQQRKLRSPSNLLTCMTAFRASTGEVHSLACSDHLPPYSHEPQPSGPPQQVANTQPCPLKSPPT
eukprot:scaffold242310_cov14-Tisochrysis_lutea.AAC.1